MLIQQQRLGVLPSLPLSRGSFKTLRHKRVLKSLFSVDTRLDPLVAQQILIQNVISAKLTLGNKLLRRKPALWPEFRHQHPPHLLLSPQFRLAHPHVSDSKPHVVGFWFESGINRQRNLACFRRRGGVIRSHKRGVDQEGSRWRESMEIYERAQAHVYCEIRACWVCVWMLGWRGAHFWIQRRVMIAWRFLVALRVQWR